MPSFSVGLPSVKHSTQHVDLSTTASPKTVFSRVPHKDVSETSVTSRSALSRRSKYSQSSLLQKSSLFSTMLHPASKGKDNKRNEDIEEEAEHLRLTIQNCNKKRTFLKESIENGRS